MMLAFAISAAMSNMQPNKEGAKGGRGEGSPAVYSPSKHSNTNFVSVEDEAEDSSDCSDAPSSKKLKATRDVGAEAAENQSVKDGSRDNSDDNSDDEKDEERENEAEEEVCWIEFKGTNDIAISKLI